MHKPLIEKEMSEKNNYSQLQNEQQDFRPIKRDAKNEVTIGKNVFSKKLTEQYSLKRQTQEFLGRNFLRFEKIDDNNVKIGIEGDIKATEDFVACFVKNLLQSNMSGYVFIGIKTPLLKDIMKVDYSKLYRLEFIKCQITNIQPLTWLNAPNFKNIYLRDNFITSIQPLKKTKFNEFTSIELDNNFVKEFTPLTRSMMTVFKEQTNNKFYLHMTQERFQTGNFTFVFKTQNTEICVVGQAAKHGNHIKQEHILDAIKRLQKPPIIPR